MSAYEQSVDSLLADQLDRELERIRDGRSTLTEREGADIVHAAAWLQAMDIHDAEPDPSSAFARILEERLNRVSTVTFYGETGSPSVARAIRRQVRKEVPSWINELMSLRAAAVFVLMVAAMIAIVGLRGQGGGDDDRPMLQAASQPEGTAEAAYSSVPLIENALDIAKCDAVARSPGIVETLIGTAPTTPDFLPRQPPPDQDRVIELSRSDFESLVTGLPDATPVEEDGALETLLQLSACRFTVFNPYNVSAASPPFGPFEEFDGSYFGLFSDDYFRRSVIPADTVADPAVMVLPWFPVGPFPQVIEDLRRLDDGRLIALVWPDNRVRWSMSVGNVIVFAHDGDRWLIDERIETTPGGSSIDSLAQSSTPPPGEPWQQVFEVSLGDDGGSFWQVPSSAGYFRENAEVLVTIANQGSAPYRFEIPDLSIQISIPAGHSVSFNLNANAGTYDYRAITGQPGDPNMQRIEGTIEFVPEGVAIPAG